MPLPYHADVWFPGYLRSVARAAGRPAPQRLWVAVTDHYEPFWKNKDEGLAAERVALWSRCWPEVARRHRDSAGRPPVWSFFYPEEEYRPALLDALARFREDGIGDVEIHIHHDGEGEAFFVDHMSRYCELLHSRHGLLRKREGRLAFGFIHGNWSLDNSRPDGRWCGLNNELILLRQLGCYADFTMPCGPSPMQAGLMNSLYWAIDDPAKPKSYDSGQLLTPGVPPPANALMMIPGPFAIRLGKRLKPKLEIGELAGPLPVDGSRVRAWFRHAPVLGADQFLKLFAHGTQERHSGPFFQGMLDALFSALQAHAHARGMEIYFVSAWRMFLAVEEALAGRDPRVSFNPRTDDGIPTPSSRA